MVQITNQIWLRPANHAIQRRMPLMQQSSCAIATDDRMDFSGESIVVDPNGDVISKADDKEQILYVDLTLMIQ